MDWFQRLPSHARPSPAGLEWAIWQRLTDAWGWGSACLLSVSGLARLWLWADGTAPAPGSRSTEPLLHPSPTPAWLDVLDYTVLGLLSFHWTAVLTVAIGCVIVMVMKGPGYVADAYPMGDTPRPR